MSAEYKEGRWIDVARQALGLDERCLAMGESFHCTEICQTLNL